MFTKKRPGEATPLLNSASASDVELTPVQEEQLEIVIEPKASLGKLDDKYITRALLKYVLTFLTPAEVNVAGSVSYELRGLCSQELYKRAQPVELLERSVFNNYRMVKFINNVAKDLETLQEFMADIEAGKENTEYEMPEVIIGAERTIKAYQAEIEYAKSQSIAISKACAIEATIKKLESLIPVASDANSYLYQKLEPHLFHETPTTEEEKNNRKAALEASNIIKIQEIYKSLTAAMKNFMRVVDQSPWQPDKLALRLTPNLPARIRKNELYIYIENHALKYRLETSNEKLLEGDIVPYISPREEILDITEDDIACILRDMDRNILGDKLFYWNSSNSHLMESYSTFRPIAYFLLDQDPTLMVTLQEKKSHQDYVDALQIKMAEAKFKVHEVKEIYQLKQEERYRTTHMGTTLENFGEDFRALMREAYEIEDYLSDEMNELWDNIDYSRQVLRAMHYAKIFNQTCAKFFKPTIEFNIDNISTDEASDILGLIAEAIEDGNVITKATQYVALLTILILFSVLVAAAGASKNSIVGASLTLPILLTACCAFGATHHVPALCAKFFPNYKYQPEALEKVKSSIIAAERYRDNNTNNFMYGNLFSFKENVVVREDKVQQEDWVVRLG